MACTAAPSIQLDFERLILLTDYQREVEFQQYVVEQFTSKDKGMWWWSAREKILYVFLARKKDIFICSSFLFQQQSQNWFQYEKIFTLVELFQHIQLNHFENCSFHTNRDWVSLHRLLFLKSAMNILLHSGEKFFVHSVEQGTVFLRAPEGHMDSASHLQLLHYAYEVAEVECPLKIQEKRDIKEKMHRLKTGSVIQRRDGKVHLIGRIHRDDLEVITLQPQGDISMEKLSGVLSSISFYNPVIRVY